MLEIPGKCTFPGGSHPPESKEFTAERRIVHRVIYDELCLGRTKPSSKEQYIDIIDNLIDNGAEGIILGCTEIGLLLTEKDARVPLFDTAKIHAVAAVEYALEP